MKLIIAIFTFVASSLLINHTVFAQGGHGGEEPYQEEDPGGSNSVRAGILYFGGAFYQGNLLLKGIFFMDDYAGNGQVVDRSFATFYDDVDMTLYNSRNDRVKSLNLQGVKAGTIIYLYDDHNKSTNDDWVEIFIKKDIQPNDRYALSNIEMTIEDDYLKSTYHSINGLNGKVSAWVVVPAP